MNTFPGANQKMQTSYYGVDGGILPIFSCGRLPLAPSLLTGNGSHLVLWVSVVLHLAALGCTIAANTLFFMESSSATKDLYLGWAISSVTMESLAVLGTVTYTGLVKEPFSMPLTTMAGFGLFLGALIATTKMSYMHGIAMDSDSAENILYNVGLFFQVYALGSIMANGLCAVAGKSSL